MAKRDDKNNQPSKRVFKSADVHKRRAGAEMRQKTVKMPTRREAREERRANIRINAESRVERPEHAGSADSSPSMRSASADATGNRSASAGKFTVIHAENPRPAGSGGTARPSDASAKAATPVESAMPAGAATPAGASAPAEAAAPVEPSAPVEAAMPVEASAPIDAAAQADAAAAADFPEADDASAGAPANRKAKRRRLRVPSKRRRIVVGVIVVVAIAALVVGGFAFNRWGRFNDRADFQGAWYVLGTDVSVRIDDSTIYLNDEVSYAYSIDDYAKTITYTFGPMEGEGRYWFSDDRSHLVITDGQGYTPSDTTAEDLMRAFLDFAKASSGDVVQLPQGDGIIAFSRTPEISIMVESQQEGAQ